MARILNGSAQKILCFLVIATLGIGIIFYKTRIFKSANVIFIHKESVQQTRISSSTLDFNENVSNWIVVTTIKYPSQDIEKLTKIQGWQLLVVGDLKTPNNWTYPGCIFLGIDQQRKLGFRTADRLPTNSYTRKVIGYLYAIQHGAKYIYDTDDDNHPSGGKINFHQAKSMSGLIYDGGSDDVMNPYAHFGQPSIWPRGYPLDRVSAPNNNTYKLCTFNTPAIQQGLVNGDPDVDAIFRMTRKAPNQRYINVTFDARAPPVTLPKDVFAPFNSQNTFFTYDAFWALFLPTSVAFRVTDIWRGYWAQRLLWLIGQRLSFFPPNAVQFRNSHNYLDDFEDETQFYLQTDSFVEFLKSWTCPNRTFFQCVSHLGHKMAAREFWGQSDAELLDSWLFDLVAIGYEEPPMRTKMFDCETSTTVYYSSSLTSSKAPSMGDFCNHTGASAKISKPEMVYDNLLLVIVFSSTMYRNIPLMETLYADHFPSVVYCGGPSINYQELTEQIRASTIQAQERPVSFINTRSEPGNVSYDCAIYAMQMNYKVDGYIVMGEDVLFNFWNLGDGFNFSTTQMQLYEHQVVDIKLSPGELSNWSMVSEAMDELNMMAQKHPDESSRVLINDFFLNRAEAYFEESQISTGHGDLFYVPKSASNMFVEIMEVFQKHHLSFEVALSTTMTGLTPHALLEGFTGTRVKNESLMHFNSTLHYLHPVKFSRILNENGRHQIFCETYVKAWFKS